MEYIYLIHQIPTDLLMEAKAMARDAQEDDLDAF